MIYEQPGRDASVTQGDIFDDCPLLLWNIEDSGSDATAIETASRVVVLTQACDMALGKATQVLVAAVHAAGYLVDKGVITARTVLSSRCLESNR